MRTALSRIAARWGDSGRWSGFGSPLESRRGPSSLPQRRGIHLWLPHRDDSRTRYRPTRDRGPR